MITRNQSRWVLYPLKVRYTNSLNADETDVTKWALPNREWWEGLDHEHITVHEFIEEEVTETMAERFEEVKFMPEDFPDIYTEYILTGQVEEVPPTHPFYSITLKQKASQQQADIDYLAIMTGVDIDV